MVIRCLSFFYLYFVFYNRCFIFHVFDFSVYILLLKLEREETLYFSLFIYSLRILLISLF